MKAYVYTEPYKIEMQERETPEPKKGEVLIRVKATSICGSDTGGFKGTSAMRVPDINGQRTWRTIHKTIPACMRSRTEYFTGTVPRIL